jgi:CheY-like chemotaxis protein
MTETSLGGSPARFQSQCILIVEDEMLLAMMLEDMLTDVGYRVVKAARVAKALELAATAAIDCAILDVNLGGANSYSVANELQRRDIPFIFSTGYGADGLHPDYHGSPMLSNPFRQQELERVIIKALATRALKI